VKEMSDDIVYKENSLRPVPLWVRKIARECGLSVEEFLRVGNEILQREAPANEQAER
jgi:hypothetical protein